MYLKDISKDDLHKYKFCLQREKDIVANKESSDNIKSPSELDKKAKN
jgi:hypothetical protein